MFMCNPFFIRMNAISTWIQSVLAIFSWNRVIVPLKYVYMAFQNNKVLSNTRNLDAVSRLFPLQPWCYVACLHPYWTPKMNDRFSERKTLARRFLTHINFPLLFCNFPFACKTLFYFSLTILVLEKMVNYVSRYFIGENKDSRYSFLAPAAAAINTIKRYFGSSNPLHWILVFFWKGFLPEGFFSFFQKAPF